jgi:integrase
VPAQKLTPAFVKGAAAEPGAERTIYWDTELPRFGLMVTSSGHRSYVIQYRADGVSRRATINAVLGLDGARKRARAILGEVAWGKDPVAERRKVVESKDNVLRSVCERYFALESRRGTLRTIAKRRATLERLVFPKLGTTQVDKIQRADINRLIDNIEHERGPAMADQTLALLRRILNWYAERSNNFVPPIVKREARAGDNERSRILNDDELRAIWSTPYAAPWGQLIKLLLFTAARRTEVSAMMWSELRDDLWVIPAARYKTGTEATLPLSAAAQEVLADIPHINECEFVFTTDGRRPVSGFSTFKLKFDIACGVKDWRLHDLRRTARSLMSRAGVAPDIAERCLGHAITGVRGVYDRHTYLDEMRQGFEALALQINQIVQTKGERRRLP